MRAANPYPQRSNIAWSASTLRAGSRAAAGCATPAWRARLQEGRLNRDAPRRCRRPCRDAELHPNVLPRRCSFVGITVVCQGVVPIQATDRWIVAGR